MKKKIIIFGIIGLLFCISIFSNVESKTINAVSDPNDDETITIEGADGNNGWYISPVDVTFHAYDYPYASSGLYCINYRIITQGAANSSDWSTYFFPDFYTEYDFTVTLDADGSHTVEFQAVDGFLLGHINNEGAVHSSQLIGIDMTAPEVTLSKEKISFNEINFTADASDSTSDIDYVEFYQNEEFRIKDDIYPYNYNWKGIGSYNIQAKAYDNAGNCQESNVVSTPQLKILKPMFLQLLQRFFKL